VREADYEGAMEIFIRAWLQRGRRDLSRRAAFELAKAETGANYFTGMRWLAGEGADPDVERRAREGLRLGLKAKILSAVILWSRG
jgi:hypothetical protein